MLLLLYLSLLLSNNNPTTTCNSSRLRTELLTTIQTIPTTAHHLIIINSILTTTGSSLLNIGWGWPVTSSSSPVPRSLRSHMVSIMLRSEETPETALPTPPSVPPPTTISQVSTAHRVLASAQLVPSNCGSSCWSSSVTRIVRTSSAGLAMAGSLE